jgi:hypothetical protein
MLLCLVVQERATLIKFMNFIWMRYIRGAAVFASTAGEDARVKRLPGQQAVELKVVALFP